MSEVQTPEAAAPDDEPLDVQGAAALLVANDQRDEKPAEPENVAAEEAPQEPETTQGTEPAREAEPEAESYDLEKIHGNTKVRLRDGTEWTAAELKRRIGDLQEVEKSRAAFTEELTKFQSERQQIAQQAQLFSQVAPQAIAAIQSSLPEVPPLPEPSLAQTDPFAYSEKLAAHLTAKNTRDQKVAQMQQIQQAAYAQAMRVQQEQAQHLATAVQTERQKLLEKFPEFADSGKAKEFQGEFTRFGKNYGFSDDELSKVYDHRMIGVMRDAIAYRKLQEAPKPKPNQPINKPQSAAPVQQPGRRASGSEQTRQKQELIRRARETGNPDDAVAAIIANNL